MDGLVRHGADYKAWMHINKMWLNFAIDLKKHQIWVVHRWIQPIFRQNMHLVHMASNVACV